MERLKRMMQLIVAGMLVLGLGVPVSAEPVTPTTTGGFLSDFDGNLLVDAQGYYVLTLRQDMIRSGEVEVSLDRFASLFLDDFKNVSSNRSLKKLRIINETGKDLVYKDYSFTTENTLPRTNNIFSETVGSFSNFMGRAYGSAYTAMMPTITSPRYRTDLCLGVRGFDGKNINLMIAPLRTVNDAVTAFYGVNHTFDITLPQMMSFDNNLRSAGYSSYGAYLKAFYGVNDLRDLTLAQAYNVLGTTNGAQSAITNWRDNSIGGKPVPAAELNRLTNEFKIWGIMNLNQDVADNIIYPYVPNFFIMERDSEVIQFAYEYLYTHGLRFTFDDARYPFDRTDSEAGRGDAFGIKAYVEKAPESAAMVRDIFGKKVFKNGAEIRLDNVLGGLYVPNAWNQHRLYDYGFSLAFKVKEGPPKTGDDAELAALMGAFIISILFIVFIAIMLRRKPSDEKRER